MHGETVNLDGFHLFVMTSTCVIFVCVTLSRWS